MALKNVVRVDNGNVIGSTIDENDSFKTLQTTLTAGQTTLTFIDSSITATSLCDLYCDGGLDYENVTSTTGSITYTFEAQASDVTFTLLVMNL